MRERDHLGDPVVDGRIILSWIFRKQSTPFVTTKQTTTYAENYGLQAY